MNTATIVTCPQCKKSQQWDSNNEFRPFCSERCKLIDFGAWANESYTVPCEGEDFQNDIDEY